MAMLAALRRSATALLRPQHRRGISFLSSEEMLDLGFEMKERLEEFGHFALKVSLTNHFTAKYPHASPSLLTDLSDVSLSRHNLAQVAQSLEAKGLLLFIKLREGGNNSLKPRSNRILMDGYFVDVATTARQTRGVDLDEYLAKRRDKDESMQTKRVTMKELAKGFPPFRAGMANYVKLAAGLTYFDANYSMDKFWEKYKEHLEPIVSPEDLENRHTDARAFEVEMKGVKEAEPHYIRICVKDQ